jgi:hypothetical protein
MGYYFLGDSGNDMGIWVIWGFSTQQIDILRWAYNGHTPVSLSV